ncbi:hypothetical protein Hanom_Chr06g00531331 [Helianthus anomalus]
MVGSGSIGLPTKAQRRVKDFEWYNRPTDDLHPKMLEVALARKREIAKKYGWPCDF